MIESWVIYLIGFLKNFNTMVFWGIIISGAFSLFFFYLSRNDLKNSSLTNTEIQELRRNCLFVSKIFLIITVILINLKLFLPTPDTVKQMAIAHYLSIDKIQEFKNNGIDDPTLVNIIKAYFDELKLK